MYCDRCGTQLAAGAQFCTSCGKAVPPGGIAQSASAPPLAPPESRVQRHIHLLAILWLISGILRLIAVCWFMIFGSIFLPGLRGWMGPAWPLGPGWAIDSFLARGFFSLGIFLAVFGALHLLLAWGLFERQPWARTLGIVLGVLALLHVPFGTALGIYTLWVLAPEQSAREYERLAHAGG